MVSLSNKSLIKANVTEKWEAKQANDTRLYVREIENCNH